MAHRILLAAKRGANFRHLSSICEKGGLQGDVVHAGLPGLPALDHAARAGCPLDTMLFAHLGRRRIDRPWLFRHALVRLPYLALLRTYTRCLYLGWVRKLRHRAPKAVVLWNGHRMPESAVKAAARFLGIRVIHIENGSLPNTRTVDAVGVNDFSCLPRNADFYRRFQARDEGEWNLAVRQWHRAKAPPRDTADALPGRYIFVPFQVDSDTQVLLHSPWIRSMRHLFDVLAHVHERLQQNPALADIRFVLKEHPTSRYEYTDLHRRTKNLPGLVFRNSDDTQALIERCAALVTINSTAGLEGLLFNKPVITLGNAFYNMPEIVLQARSENELLQAIEESVDFRPDLAVRNGLVVYLRDYYCVPKDPARNGQDDWRAMAERIRTLANADEFELLELPVR